MNRWIFEGLYREGHREGPGEELYETKASQTLVNFLDKKNNNNSDSNGGGGKEDEGHAKKNGYAYDDDQGNVTALQVLTPTGIPTNTPPHFSALDNNQLNNQFTKQKSINHFNDQCIHHVNEENETVVVDDDGTSAHRRLPLRYAGRWEKTYILPRGIHSQKLGPGRFSGKSK